MPTHLIFGREIKGKVELRPGHLARECPGGTAAELTFWGVEAPMVFLAGEPSKTEVEV